MGTVFLFVYKRCYGIKSLVGDHSALGKKLKMTLDTEFTEKLTEIITANKQ